MFLSKLLKNKNSLGISFLTITLTLLLLYLFAIPKDVKATCWCEDPVANDCRCQRSGVGPYRTTYQGVAISCDTPEELTSAFTLQAPICGSSPEIIPYCAPDIANPSFWVCYGGDFAQGASNIPINGSGTATEPILWNGVTFGSAGDSYYSCGSNVFCCANPDIQCDSSGVPPAPSSCEPRDPSVVPPASICASPPPGYIPASGGTPIPQPYVPCNEVRDQEFHSLRPYQASPCNTNYEDLALFCGNDFILIDEVTIVKDYANGFSSWTYLLDGVPIATSSIPSPPGGGSSASVNLNDFIAGANFVEHSLSTGENIRFTSEGGSGPGSPVRMYKNSNYEQFFVAGSGTYRREDTSWAPLPGFQDALCTNGSTAAYTLDPGCTQYSSGQQVTSDGAFWAPSSASTGDAWSTEPHQIVTIQDDTSSGRIYCPLSNLSGYDYPQACYQTATLQYTAFYPASTYTFCTGISNPEDLVEIRVMGGPGTGDTFYFMRGWGLVGFVAPGFEAGLMGPGADPSACVGAGTGGICRDNGNGTETCTFVVNRTRNIAIELTEAELAIMGNTECVRNSTNFGDESCIFGQPPSDPYDPYDPYNPPPPQLGSGLVWIFDDPLKVNEYVSWYLNGVIGRAEYDSPDPNEDYPRVYPFISYDPYDPYAPPSYTPYIAPGRRKIIDYSGPLKKLLSFESQIVRRMDEVTRAVSRNLRHNQIIGCINLLGDPTECYPGRIGVSDIRLSYWPSQFPPLRRAFATFQEYSTAFTNWRNSTFWRLFSYIPFSSTEDRLGQLEMGTYPIQPPLASEAIILATSITNQSPSDLFFAHMQEGEELGRLFQTIFTPGEFTPEGELIDELADESDIVPSVGPFCDLREVRSNPGDDLFANTFTATVDYTAQVSCTFVIAGDGRICGLNGGTCQSFNPLTNYCNTYYGQADCPASQICGSGCSTLPQSITCNNLGAYSCYPTTWGCTYLGQLGCPSGFACASDAICTQPISDLNLSQSCTVSVAVAYRVITETPLANQVWSRLVAGPAAVFRRLFPEIEDVEGRPIRRLWDLPTVTSADYLSLDGLRVLAGNPSLGRPGSEAEIYFPHIGGIHEYFLRCIQKTIRPQGFGQGCLNAPDPTASTIDSPYGPYGYPGGLSSGSCANPPPPGAIAPAAGRCQIGTGLCSPSTLKALSGGAWSDCEARQASIICNVESGGNPSALNCGCFLGRSVDYSVGLFQINLLAHCPGALNYTWSPPWCEVVNQSQVDACLDRFFDAAQNAQYAYQLSAGGTRWTPWAAYTVACRDAVDAQCP